MSEPSETELAQALDAAVAAYQRRYGRPRTLAKLEHMLDRSRQAQRVLDEASAPVNGTIPKAAE